MYIIAKEFKFSASHVLRGLPSEHPCSKLHGHNYIVKIEVMSDKLDEKGFVIDYRDLSPIKEWIDRHFDHQHLNDRMICNPTAENIAKMIFDNFKPQYKGLYAVTVKETDATSAIYYKVL